VSALSAVVCVDAVFLARVRVNMILTIYVLRFVSRFRYELGRQPANTKLSSNVCVRQVRCRGGNVKHRALRLDTGNFAWGSEACTRKTRILDVVYNASNNELVRTKTLVKGAIVAIDAAPYRAWYAQHYGKKIGIKVKNGAKVESEDIDEKRSKSVTMKLRSRNREHSVESAIDEQFSTGRLLACISSRPGQCGRADGYVLEGKELEFYQRKMQKKKHAKAAAGAAAAAAAAAVAAGADGSS